MDRPGILYQDTVQGKVRVLYYHLNNTKIPQKVAVVLENANHKEKANMVRVTRGGTAWPSDDYLWVGKTTQNQYFGEQKNDLVLVMKDKKRLLQSSMDEIILQPGQLVYGVYDFNADHPVKTSVIIYPANVDPFSFMNIAKVLPRDSVALRGTFKGMDSSPLPVSTIPRVMARSMSCWLMTKQTSTRWAWMPPTVPRR